jgi:RND family efflux transporter MFP subunit
VSDLPGKAMALTFLKVLLPVALVAAGGLGAKALIDARPAPEVKPPERRDTLVRVTPVSTERLSVRVNAHGEVQPRTETELVAEVAGRVLEVSPHLARGAFIEEGEVLVRVDARDFELAQAQAQLALARAELRLSQEEKDAEIARRDWEEMGRGEASPLVLREPQVNEARAQVEAARAELERARRDVERCTLRAPYPGRVREEFVDVGQFVARGARIAVVYAVDFAEVRLPLPDRELRFVELPFSERGEEGTVGPRVVLRARFAGEEHSWEGRIVRTEGELDPQSRMVVAVARVENPYGRGEETRGLPLAVGMFVRAEIEGRSFDDVVPLPRSALRGADSVWVVGEEDRLEVRRVEVLRGERDRVVVHGGLEPGELVVTTPIEVVTDGMTVRVVGVDE